MDHITQYTPWDWYWIVAEDESWVYASRSNTYVAASDPTYVAWSANKLPSPVPSESVLWESVGGSIVPLWMAAPDRTGFVQETAGVLTKDQLKRYSGEVKTSTLTGGVTINGLPFATDAVTVGSLNSAVLYTQTNPAQTFSWKLPDGSWATVDAAGIINLHTCVSGFGQECQTVEADVGDEIDAATISDPAAVDATFALINKTFTGVTGLKKRGT